MHYCGKLCHSLKYFAGIFPFVGKMFLFCRCYPLQQCINLFDGLKISTFTSSHFLLLHLKCISRLAWKAGLRVQLTPFSKRICRITSVAQRVPDSAEDRNYMHPKHIFETQRSCILLHSSALLIQLRHIFAMLLCTNSKLRKSVTINVEWKFMALLLSSCSYKCVPSIVFALHLYSPLGKSLTQ